MSTLEQMREGLHRVWDNLAEGWQQLRDTASNAITRFKPVRRSNNLQTVEDQYMLRGARWGLLAADVEEDDKHVIVRLEVPGMDASEFDISVAQDHLVVRGTKRAQREHTEGSYHIMECAYGAFERAIPLPCAVDETKTKARYKHGVLSVELPKTKASQRRRIEVST